MTAQPLEIYTEAAVYLICATVPGSAANTKNAISSIARCQDKAESHGADGYKLWHGAWHTVGVSRNRLQDKSSLVTTCCIM